MLYVLIFVGALAYVISLATQKRRSGDPGKKMTVAQKIGLGIAIVISAFGLFVVGAMIFFAMAMSSYGSNK